MYLIMDIIQYIFHSQGGASIEEDSWVQQLKATPHYKRGLKFPSRLGFVGDDTWVRLAISVFFSQWIIDDRSI